MNHRGLKLLVTLTLVSVLAGNFLFALPTFAAGELVKAAQFDTVYYVDAEGVRHPFPNATTYRSWYGNDYFGVTKASDDYLASLPLGRNITIRPGTFLVKVPSDPTVYAVEQGGVLREIVDSDVAAAIYGQDWATRVVDVSEVFFTNYAIGEPIKHTYTVPNDILFQEQSTGKYFYKQFDLLRPFASADAVISNKFRLTDAVVSQRSIFAHQRIITDFDRSIFNPVATSLQDSRDCEAEKLKAAVIFLVDGNYTASQIEKVQTIVQAVPSRYAWATDNLSTIDLNHPTAVVIDDGSFLKTRSDGTIEVSNEVVNAFYETNPDQFDFIIILTNFKIKTENDNELAHFIPVSNKLEGNGRAILARSGVYGSAGKLKGIIMMGDIAKYSTVDSLGINQTLNVVLHEILHQWTAYIAFVDPAGQTSQKLLLDDEPGHWSYYSSFISPIGGSGFLDNKNGTFTSTLSQLTDSNLRPFSPLDLYLMGLIPAQLMGPVSYVEPTLAGTVGNTITGTLKTVTVDQIIAANGPVKCSID